MEGTSAMPRWRIGIGAWSLTVAAAIAVPLGVLAYVLTPPLSEVRLDDPVQHFTITTNVSLIAAAVSLGVLRSALDMRHWPSVLVGLGFLSLGGLFLMHGLATPGVLFRDGAREVAATSILALAAQLAMAVPAYFFAARYTPILGWLQRSRVVTPRGLLAAVAFAIVAFDLTCLVQPVFMSDVLESMTGYGLASAYGGTALQANPGWVAATAGTTVLLLAFSAFRQSADFARTRLPTHAALAIAFLFQGEAQVAAALGEVYSAAFWEYHALLALAPSAMILFTDLRGSTALAERATPEAAVATVNAYLRAMARAVLDEGGILDKFTGDGLMAIFGAMSDPASGAHAAARAALRIRTDVAAVNAERQARGEPVIGYGVGINTGDVVLGAVGLPDRSDYTAMGDTVNTAARMESLTKELGTDVVLSEATAAHLDGSVTLRPLGSAAVKGKSAPLAVFTLGR